LKYIIFAIVLTVPGIALGQHRVSKPEDCLTEEGESFVVECSEEKPENCSQYVCQYIPAPFKGYLLTEGLMSDLFLGKKNAVDRAKKDIDTQAKKYEEKLRYQEEIHKEDLRLSNQARELWKEQAEANQPHWYNHPGIWIGLGVVSTSLLAIGLTYGLKEANSSP